MAIGMVFIVLATANGAGYRFGVSDQAFYIPVITRTLEPGLFPRDASLIDAQGRLMVLDELIAGFIDYSGWPIEGIFLSGYVLSLALLWAGVVIIGTRLFASPWAVVALGAALTLRHRVPRTSANSLEPYFHPRMLAFSIGVLAIAAFLRMNVTRSDSTRGDGQSGAGWLAIVLVGISGILHPTTGLWFAVLIGTALAVAGATFRRLVFGGALAAAVLLLWAATTGPLQAAAVRMDDVWLQAVASKDSLFPTSWPLWAWAANLGLVGVVWWAHASRRARGTAHATDRALVWGATALAVLFLLTLPPVAAAYALPVQFQISRVFWLIDFVATLYVVAALTDASTRRAVVVAMVLLVASVARGTYIMLVERPERPLFEMRIADSPWEDAMRWLSWQPRDAHVLADPGHAWKFGTSVRVSAAHDVFIEEVKDSALAIYSREVAGRFVERSQALGDFGTLDPERVRALARQYDLHFLVSEQNLTLPVAYRNRQFRIYSLQ
jgi:hypothetical protein